MDNKTEKILFPYLMQTIEDALSEYSQMEKPLVGGEEGARSLGFNYGLNKTVSITNLINKRLTPEQEVALKGLRNYGEIRTSNNSGCELLDGHPYLNGFHQGLELSVKLVLNGQWGIDNAFRHVIEKNSTLVKNLD